MNERIWKSGANAMEIWKKQKAPTHVVKIDIYGKISEPEPIPQEEGEWPWVPPTWIPPSEDPVYQKKWAYWRNIFAHGEHDERR
jgi:hypothetical protein